MNTVAGLYGEYGYEKRLTMLEAEFPGANILMHKLGRFPSISVATFLTWDIGRFGTHGRKGIRGAETPKASRGWGMGSPQPTRGSGGAS